MANARILGKSFADDVTLTVTSAATNYPKTNLQNTQVRRTWRSTSDSPLSDQTISGTFSAPKTINAIHFENVNFSGSETITAVLNDGSSPPLSTQTFSKWTKDLTYAAATYFYSTAVSGVTTFSITISDPTNSDGYIEAGRLKLGQYFDAPSSQNIKVGPDYDIMERAPLVETRGGGFRQEAKTPRRTIGFEFHFIHEDDSYAVSSASFADYLRTTGSRDDSLISLYPGQGDDMEREFTMLGFLVKRSTLSTHITTYNGSALKRWQKISMVYAESL